MIYQAPVIETNPSSWDAFATKLNSVFGEHEPLSSLVATERLNELRSLALQFFPNEIAEINSALSNPEKGIVALDVSSVGSASARARAWTAVGFASAVMDPSRDSVNGTPFTLYNASPEHEQTLASLGLAYHTPTEKLGYHSDGLIQPDGIYVSRTLMLHNLLMAYEKPGDFYWAPSATWREKGVFEGVFGVNEKYPIALTPIAYGTSAEDVQIREASTIDVPIFWRNGDDETVFLNGQIVGEKNERILRAMRTSIRRSANQFTGAQRIGRTIFARNSSGFHARDVMEKPVAGNKYTRSMIRTVDCRGFRIA